MHWGERTAAATVREDRSLAPRRDFQNGFACAIRDVQIAINAEGHTGWVSTGVRQRIGHIPSQNLSDAATGISDERACLRTGGNAPRRGAGVQDGNNRAGFGGPCGERR